MRAIKPLTHRPCARYFLQRPWRPVHRIYVEPMLANKLWISPRGRSLTSHEWDAALELFEAQADYLFWKLNGSPEADAALWALMDSKVPAVLCESDLGGCGQPCQAALIEYEHSPWPIDIGDIKPEDRRALICPGPSLVPAPGMGLQVNGSTWLVVRSFQMGPPGPTVLYACQVRPPDTS
ncbi:hypothetical protein [Roseateles noduli]|uniref:hypothetical protein n=1 Tax=Roseateles noduli TaxID=2052484 RepID=UPI003D651680